MKPATVCLVLILLQVGCNVASRKSLPEKSARAMFPLPTLAKKGPADADRLLGKPQEVTGIPDGIDSPGEFREYRVTEKRHLLTIRYFKGKPASFICEFEPAVTNMQPEEIASMFGFDVANKTANRSMEGIMYWQGVFDGVWFDDVRLTRDSDGPGYVEFRARPRR